MSDVYKQCRFYQFDNIFTKVYYPMAIEDDVTVFREGDYVNIICVNDDIIKCGKIRSICNKGFMMQSGYEKIAVTFDEIKDIRKLHKKDDKVKEALAELVGGSPNDSFHDLTVKLLFGQRKKPGFEYKDISDLVFKPNYTGKMPPERFQELLDELDGNSLQTLKEKNTRYSSDGDSLHNFRSGAEVAGGTPAQACWGYMTKHLVALRDMVMKNDFSNREDFLEKCQDTINYVRFLWCIGNDASNSEIKNNKKENE